MEKDIFKTENGNLFEKIAEPLIDVAVSLVIMASFLFIIMSSSM
jgi:hypothetical protein